MLRGNRGVLLSTLIFTIVAVSGTARAQDEASQDALPGQSPISFTADHAWLAPPELTPWTGSQDPAWTTVGKLAREGQFAQAIEIADALVTDARERAASEDTVRGIFWSTRLRDLQGSRVAGLDHLLGQAWPRDLLAQVALGLFLVEELGALGCSSARALHLRATPDSAASVAAWPAGQVERMARETIERLWAWRERLGELPATALGGLVDPGTYPSAIRPSLRDVVGHLAVDYLFSPFCGMEPEPDSPLRLDLGSLLGPPSPATTADLRSHRLARLAGILTDLEAWHLAQGHREAALDTYLRRLWSLHWHRDYTDDRQRIRDSLAARLEEYRDVRWYAVGMEALAQMTRQGTAPEARAQALALARRGEKAFPDSLGGRMCKRLREELETSELRLSGEAQIDPARPSIELHHRNLGAVWFKIIAFDLRSRLEPGGRGYPLLDRREATELLRTGKVLHAWRQTLPGAHDPSEHHTRVRLPSLPEGAYWIFASPRADFAIKDNPLWGMAVQASQLMPIIRSTGQEIEVLVLDAETGSPRPGVKVRALGRDAEDRLERWSEVETDAQGSARWAAGTRAPLWLEIAGERGSLLSRYSSRTGQSRSPLVRTLTLTERATYWIGENVRWLSIACRGEAGQRTWHAVPAHPMKLGLSGTQGFPPVLQEVSTNSHGTASGELRLPRDRIGRWRLAAGAGSIGGTIRILDRDEPRVYLAAPKADGPLRLGAPLTLEGMAWFQDGRPPDGSEVSWWVETQPDAQRWETPEEPIQMLDPRMVATGTCPLLQDGTFRLTFVPRADPQVLDQAPEANHGFMVRARVLPEKGRAGEGVRAFTLGSCGMHVRWDAATPAFFEAGVAPRLTLLRQDALRNPKPGKGHWRLMRLRSPLRTREPTRPTDRRSPWIAAGRRLRQVWLRSAYGSPGVTEPAAEMADWVDAGQRAAGVIQHGSDGRATLQLPKSAAGAYRLRYSTRDVDGLACQQSWEFLVVAPGARIPLPALLEVQHARAEVGEVARAWASTGYANQSMILEAYQAGELIERRSLGPEVRGSLQEFPVTAAHRGGFALRLLVVHDHQILVQERSIDVPWSEHELQAEVLPAHHETDGHRSWRLSIRGRKGDPPELGEALVSVLPAERLRGESPEWLGPDVFLPRRERAGDLSTVPAPAEAIELAVRSNRLPDQPPELRMARLLAPDRRAWAPMSRRGMHPRLLPGLDSTAVRPAIRQFSFRNPSEVELQPRGSVPVDGKSPPPGLWLPQLELGADGQASFPWNLRAGDPPAYLRVQVITPDLEVGRLHQLLETAPDR